MVRAIALTPVSLLNATRLFKVAVYFSLLAESVHFSLLVESHPTQTELAVDSKSDVEN